MSRTTINIDDPVLQDVKALQKIEKKPLGQLVSELLALGISKWREKSPQRQPFRWGTAKMRARIDLRDRDAVWDVLDSDRDDGR